MKVIAVANLKGGVAKTATAHALGVALSSTRSVLLVDADPQASLSHACGITDAQGQSLADVLDSRALKRRSLRDVIRQIDDRLAIVPAHTSLSRLETFLRDRTDREVVLKQALASIERDRGWARPFSEYSSSHFDVAIIDTPPSLGILTVNALAAADGVLIPTVPESLAYESLRLFFEHLGQIRQRLNPRLKILGILPTFYDSRLRHHRAIMEMMRLQGYPVLDVTVGRSVRVAEASSVGQSVVTFSRDNKRALEYAVLGMVIGGWLDDLEQTPAGARRPSLARD